jgi:hypothetical protein
VAETVIDALEMVGVDQKQRAPVRLAAGAVQRREETLAVQEPGHHIPPSLFGELGMRLLQRQVCNAQILVEPMQPFLLPVGEGAGGKGDEDRAENGQP